MVCGDPRPIQILHVIGAMTSAAWRHVRGYAHRRKDTTGRPDHSDPAAFPVRWSADGAR